MAGTWTFLHPIYPLDLLETDRLQLINVHGTQRWQSGQGWPQRESGRAGAALCVYPERTKTIMLLASKAQWKHFIPFLKIFIGYCHVSIQTFILTDMCLLRVQIRGLVRYPRPTLSLFWPPISLRFLFFEAVCILGGSSSSSTSGKDTSSNPSN